MIADKQTGLMPSWPRGRGIAETFGYLAQLTFFVKVGTIIVGQIFPDLDPGDPSLYDVGIGLVMASVFAAIWLALRKDRLRLALLGVAGLGLALAGLILWVMVRNMRTGESLGGFEGLVLYGFGSLCVFGCWLAFREIRAEAARREAQHA